VRSLQLKFPPGLPIKHLMMYATRRGGAAIYFYSFAWLDLQPANLAYYPL
jgi:hypothetical protein